MQVTHLASYLSLAVITIIAPVTRPCLVYNTPGASFMKIILNANKMTDIVNATFTHANTAVYTRDHRCLLKHKTLSNCVIKKKLCETRYDTIIQWCCHMDNIECHLVDKNKSKNHSSKLYGIFRRAFYR